MDNPATVSAFRLYRIYVLAVVIFLTGNLAIRQIVERALLPGWATISIALATVLPFVAAAVLFRRLLASEMDELVQRVVLEGLAFAFVTTMPLVAIYTNLSSAGARVPRLDAPDVIMLPLLMVGLGVTLSWRRYQ